MRRRITVVLLAALVALAAAGCNKADNGGGKKNGEMKIWTASGFAKVLADVDYSAEEDYAAYYSRGTFEVSLYRNEYEAGQIILTPTADVAEYDIALSDLKTASGAVLKEEDMTVYEQKYVNVSIPSPSHTNSMLGMMPDAMLPFDVAKKFGENKIAGGANQGIIVEIHTSENQPAGVYEGNFTVTADGKDYAVPAKVTVYDAAVSSTTHSKSLFIQTKDRLAKAELDASFEMYERYYEKFLDYRICYENMPKRDTTLDEFVSQLKKYHDDPRASMLGFFPCENSAWTAYDADKFDTAIRRIAEESFADNKNYFEKVTYDLSILDEPQLNKTTDKIAPTLKAFAKKQHAYIREIEAGKAGLIADGTSEEVIEAVIDKIEHFPFLITTAYNEAYTYEANKSVPEDPDEAYEFMPCPYYSSFNTAQGRAENSTVADDGYVYDAWFYGCNYPVNPYVNYHLDDALLPSRLLGWMQYNYNVVGNLYWAVNDLLSENEYGVSEAPENVYEDLANDAYLANGEGFLVYPGKMYGLDCFVPSLRLMAIRDGLEDYEILLSTGDTCTALAKEAGIEGYDLDNTFSKLYEALYQGTRVMGDFNDFEVSRELLANFSSLANGGAIISRVENLPLSTEVGVYAANGAVVRVNGAEASYTAKGSGKEYTIPVVQTEDANYLDFTLEANGKTVPFRMYVGGKKTRLDLDGIALVGGNNNTINDVTPTSNGNGSVTVKMGALKNTSIDDKTQRVYLTGDRVKSNIKRGVTAIVVEIENLENADVTVSFKYQGTRSSTVRDALSATIPAGATQVVTFETGTLDWTQIGAFNEFRLYFDYKDDGAAERQVRLSITLTY